MLRFASHFPEKEAEGRRSAQKAEVVFVRNAKMLSGQRGKEECF